MAERDDNPADALRGAECVSETPCFDRIFSRYDTGDGCFGTEHLASLLLDMGFSCAPRVLDRALDDMDPNAAGEITKLMFLEWFEAKADEIDVPSAATPSTRRSATSPRSGGGGRGGLSSPRSFVDNEEDAGDGSLSQVTSAMLEAKNSCKHAEADVHVLSNRLMHLRAEDAKAQRRIEEANRRAKEIEAIQRRNAERQRAKLRAIAELESEIKRTHDNNQLVVATSRSRKHQTTTAIASMRAQIVQETRAEREMHLQRIQQKRDLEQRQLSDKSKEIRSQEKVAIKKREQQKKAQEKDILAQARARLALEHEKTLRNEKLIQQMEQEEAALIEKLRISHEMQRAAYEHLAFVIHDDEQ